MANAEHYRQQIHAFVNDVHTGLQPVYANNIQQIHEQALKLNFPCLSEALCGVLGEAQFKALTQVYVLHYPATAWDINQYGADFASLLAVQQAPLAEGESWSTFADLAALEHAVVLAYYANDACQVEFTLSSNGVARYQQALLNAYPFLQITLGLRWQAALCIERRQHTLWVRNV